MLWPRRKATRCRLMRCFLDSTGGKLYIYKGYHVCFTVEQILITWYCLSYFWASKILRVPKQMLQGRTVFAFFLVAVRRNFGEFLLHFKKNATSHATSEFWSWLPLSTIHVMFSSQANLSSNMGKLSTTLTPRRMKSFRWRFSVFGFGGIPWLGIFGSAWDSGNTIRSQHVEFLLPLYLAKVHGMTSTKSWPRKRGETSPKIEKPPGSRRLLYTLMFAWHIWIYLICCIWICLMISFFHIYYNILQYVWWIFSCQAVFLLDGSALGDGSCERQVVSL